MWLIFPIKLQFLPLKLIFESAASYQKENYWERKAHESSHEIGRPPAQPEQVSRSQVDPEDKGEPVTEVELNKHVNNLPILAVKI